MAALHALPRSVAPIDYDQLHRDSASAHAVMRSAQRSVRPLGYRDVLRHQGAIAVGEAESIGGCHQRQLYVIEEEGLTFYAVWCCRLRCIVTYLAGPHQWIGTLLTARQAR